MTKQKKINLFLTSEAFDGLIAQLSVSEVFALNKLVEDCDLYFLERDFRNKYNKINLDDKYGVYNLLHKHKINLIDDIKTFDKLFPDTGLCCVSTFEDYLYANTIFGEDSIFSPWEFIVYLRKNRE